MRAHTARSCPRSGAQRGVTMIEILVALVITLIGLFSLIGFNLRAYQTESESYQRSQALVLVEDMAQRIRSNRAGFGDYAVAETTGGAPEACDPAALPSDRDLCEWTNLLRGAAETTSAGANIGAMADARGCIAIDAPAAGASGASTATVVVVWRGTVQSATRANAPCEPAGFDAADGFMRYVSSIVRFGELDGV